MRTVILGVAVVFTAGLAALTGVGLADGGHTGLAIVSVLIIGTFAFGIVGALRHPPED